VLRNTEGAQDLMGGFSDAPLGVGAIRAYHGSPHNFERFGIGKIGTGEGAQAYGHGLYFAENPETAAQYKKAFDARSGSEADAKTYEVAINADPEQFLLWDRPLAEQPQKVQELWKRHFESSGSTYERKDIPATEGTYVPDARSGAEIYHALAPRVSRTINSRLGPYVTYPKDEVAASELLREAGIPGVKYLDQGSRGTGAGTYNYVLFSDDLITILRKYGWAGLLAGGYAHFTAPSDQAHGMARGGAAQADDMTPEDWESVRQWYRELIEDKAHRGKLHFSPIPVRGMAPPGSFRISKDVIAALGDGDLKVGGAVVHSMFGIEDSPDDPTIIHGDAVRIIGGGNINTGRRVLEKFVAQVRRQSREGAVLHYTGRQHDDDHGWSVA
jgi:hypothetical protein